MSIYALILAGGAGTRFWPASRARLPKQLLGILSERPLLAETIDRVRPVVGADERIFISSAASVAAATSVALPTFPEERILIEPVGRNTAPCIGWGAATIAREDPEAIVIVLPSDHHVTNLEAFTAALEAAIASAKDGHITTLGITPTRPETGYGYIEIGEKLGSGPSHRVARFVEKPDAKRAEAFVAGGRHLWNGGMFIFRAADMSAAIRAHLPALADGLAAFDAAAKEGREKDAVAARFCELPSISIDVGVMEKVEGLRVIPVDMGWSDVGSWEAAWELAPRDEAENAVRANAILIDARGNYVLDLRTRAVGERERVISLVGVSEMVVVATDDALLVVPRARAQEVKKVVDALRATGKTELL
jgi:mannose-1-phosphate guanylyltransferase